MKFVFADGEKLGVYTDGKTELFESSYITRFRENTIRGKKNKEWKKSTDRMMYDDYFDADRFGEDGVSAVIHAVALTTVDNNFLYAFSVNETSGVYYKFTDDEAKTEAHALSSNDVDFVSLTTCEDGSILGAAQTDEYTARIAVFSRDGGDYKCLTGGDSFDENPYFDGRGNILFNSYAIGRDGMGAFVRYMPSEIYRLNPRTLQLDTPVSDPAYSFIKPMTDKAGDLFCIRKPGTDKEKKNPLIEILLIPVRIVQAIVGFISTFVMCFSGKPLVDGNGKGRTTGDGSAAKNGPNRKVVIHNQILNVEKEMKKNSKSKTEDYGFIPRSWKLVKLKGDNDDFSDGSFDKSSAEELASGVGDFCIVNDNGEEKLVYTNGRHIFELRNENGAWKRKKLLDTEFCLRIGSIVRCAGKDNDNDDLFERL